MTEQSTKRVEKRQLERWEDKYLDEAKNFSKETIRGHRINVRKFFIWYKAPSKEALRKHDVEDEEYEFEPLDYVEYRYPSTHYKGVGEPEYSAEEICEMEREDIEDKLFVGDERFGLIDAEECIDYEKRHENRQTVIDYFKDKVTANPEIEHVEVTEEDIKSITRNDIYDFMVYLREEDISKGTASKYKTSLKHFIRWSSLSDYANIREDRIIFDGKLNDILNGFDESHGYNGGKTLDYDDCVELLKEFNDPKYRALILTLLKTGIRREELVNIKISDVYLEDNFIHIRKRKGGKKADVIFDDEAKKYLKMYIQSKEHDSQDDYLFTHNKGKQYSPSTLTGRIQDMGDKVGLKLRGPHDFRHTYSNHYSGKIGDSEAGQEVYKKIQMSHKLTTSEEYRAKKNSPGEGPTKERFEDYERAVPKYMPY